MANVSFRELFKRYGLSDEQIEKYAGDILAVGLVRLISESESVVGPEDWPKVVNLLEKQNVAEAVQLVTSKYSEESWKAFVNTQAELVMKSYEDEVLER